MAPLPLRRVTLIAISLALSACAKPQPSAQPAPASLPPVKWTPLFTDKTSGVSWSYDRSGIDFARESGRIWIRRSGDKQLLLAQLKEDKMAPASLALLERDYAYSIDSLLINLKDNTLWYAASTFYSADGKPLASVANGKPNYRPADPGTLSERILTLVLPSSPR